MRKKLKTISIRNESKRRYKDSFRLTIKGGLSPDEITGLVQMMAIDIEKMRAIIWNWYWRNKLIKINKFPGWLQALQQMREEANN